MTWGHDNDIKHDDRKTCCECVDMNGTCVNMYEAKLVLACSVLLVQVLHGREQVMAKSTSARVRDRDDQRPTDTERGGTEMK